MSMANKPPDGWHPQRDRQRWALGRVVCFVGQGQVSEAQINAAGVLPTDYIAGVINLSTVAEAQADLTKVTPAANQITTSETPPWTNNNYYLVVVHRRQEDDR